MSFRSRMSKTYEAIKSYGKQSLSKLAALTNGSKSSVQRQTKKIHHRSEITGADFFETADGELWLRHLVLGATLVFGLQAKVGGARLALFFEIICITEFVGVSESSMLRLKKAMMQKLLQYQKELQPHIDQLASNMSIVVGADETFFDRLLILLFMDLSSGFIFLEQDAPDRKASTWSTKTAVVRHKFKKVLCVASDRGKSIIKFTKNANIHSIAELFHLQQSVVRLFKYAFATKRRSLKKQEKALKKELKQLINDQADAAVIEDCQQSLKDIANKHIIINQGQTTYRQQLTTISTTVHPFDCNGQLTSSSEIYKKLHSSLTVFRSITESCDIKDSKGRLNYFENHIKDMSSLIDLWWQWVNCDLENKGVNPELKSWLTMKLLPVLYWQQQIKKSRASKSLKEYYITLHQEAEKTLHDPHLSNEYMSPQWMDWSKDWVLKFQRSTSQVEGRNARLSEHHHCLRGLGELHIQSDTILSNFWITRDDNTTATERLFKFKPPNVFEWLCDNMPELAQPRQRWKKSKSRILRLEATAAA